MHIILTKSGPQEIVVRRNGQKFLISEPQFRNVTIDFTGQGFEFSVGIANLITKTSIVAIVSFTGLIH